MCLCARQLRKPLARITKGFRLKSVRGLQYWEGHGPGCSVMNIIHKAAEVIEYSHEGAFNDLDMLEVGLGGMSEEEQ